MTLLSYMLSLDANEVIKIGMFIIAATGLWFTISSESKKRFKELENKKADKDYVNQQDRSLHHRIDEVKTDHDKTVNEVNRKLDLLIKHLLK